MSDGDTNTEWERALNQPINSSESDNGDQNYLEIHPPQKKEVWRLLGHDLPPDLRKGDKGSSERSPTAIREKTILDAGNQLKEGSREIDDEWLYSPSESPQPYEPDPVRSIQPLLAPVNGKSLISSPKNETDDRRAPDIAPESGQVSDDDPGLPYDIEWEEDEKDQPVFRFDPKTGLPLVASPQSIGEAEQPIPRFDPKTGLPLADPPVIDEDDEPVPRFDPKTGLPLADPPVINEDDEPVPRFDPKTGLPLASPSVIDDRPVPRFDPKTGKPLNSEGKISGQKFEKPNDEQARKSKTGLKGLFGKQRQIGKKKLSEQELETEAPTQVKPNENPVPRFDPKTGLPLADPMMENQSVPRFDPKTGLPLAAPQVLDKDPVPRFDPKTGKLIVTQGKIAGQQFEKSSEGKAGKNKTGLKGLFGKRIPPEKKPSKPDRGADSTTQVKPEPRKKKGKKDKDLKKSDRDIAKTKKKGFSLSGLFGRGKVNEEIATLFFDPGPLSHPSHEGSLKDVNITYAIDPPFQYVHIEFDRNEGALIYKAIEPALSPDEERSLQTIEKAFDRLISINIHLIAGGEREAYLKERFLTIIKIFGIKLTQEQTERMFFQLRKRYLGYGRVDTLMKDRYIEDISCNGSNLDLYVQHRVYGSFRTEVRYDPVELNNFVLKLAQIGGRHISLLQPIRDVSLPDGSRANLTLGGEVTKKGSTFTIRKFRSNPISPIEMMDYGTIDAAQLAYLWILMEYKRSILVSGGTATGKTTLLNVLCSFIPTEIKIVSIEDTAELNLMHPNWIQSVTRTGFGGSEGGDAGGLSGIGGGGGGRKAPGDISLYDLLVAALRQRPDFIIVGEVRGTEAFTLFQAIAVGHAALGTIHAGSMNELLSRVESNPMNVPRSLFANLDAVIFPMHIKKGDRNLRRVANITEMLELDRDKGDLITNTAYKWIPETDTYKSQGKSFLFDKIRDIYGIRKDYLQTELKNRTELLDWMQKNKIHEYHACLEMIRLYYRDKEEAMGMVAENKIPQLNGVNFPTSS